MNFSFAITTDYSDVERLNEIVDSIRNLSIPNYEILVIGKNLAENHDDIRYIFFDDEKTPGWITKKKNILVEQSVYENVVVFHDYYIFDSMWYKNFLDFGNDWEICSNAQNLITGKRHFVDWVIWDSLVYPRYHSLEYNDWSHTKNMYISGGYFLVKKHVIKNEPLNENLLWGQSEDVEWSLRVRDKYVIKCNGKSAVKHNKVHRDCL